MHHRLAYRRRPRGYAFDLPKLVPAVPIEPRRGDSHCRAPKPSKWASIICDYRSAAGAKEKDGFLWNATTGNIADAGH